MAAQEAARLSSRLLSASKINDEKSIATEFQQRLGTSAFRQALNISSEDGGINGWSTMLKALVLKLMGDRKGSHAELINALSRLVEEADRAGALFSGHTVHQVVGHILEKPLDESNSKLYWSVLGTLASQAEYSRAVGREAAQKRCKELTEFAWATLLPSDSDGGGGGSGGRGQTMRASAARLLTRLLLNFPYALPEESLSALLHKLTVLARHCTPQPSPSSSAAAAGSSGAGEDELAMDDADDADASMVVHELRPLLHKLWAAANAVLRRQAADSTELLWGSSRGFVHSDELHKWLEWGLCTSDQPELLLQLVQFGRLLHGVSKLIGSHMPARIEAIVGEYVTRELSSCLLLASGCVFPLLRLSASSATGAAALANYPPLCALDLAASHLLSVEPAASAAPRAETPAEAGDAAHGKRKRPQPLPHPTWLTRLLSLDEASNVGPASSTGSSAAPAPLPGAWPTDGPAWARRVLVLAAILKRLAPRAGGAPTLSEVSLAAAARKLLPMATRAVDDDPELQLCALTALLALQPLATSDTSSRAASARPAAATSARVWDDVWIQVWNVERLSWVRAPLPTAQTDAPDANTLRTPNTPPVSEASKRAAALAKNLARSGPAALISELRQRLLGALCDTGVVSTTLVATSAHEGRNGVLAAAGSASIARAHLASCLLAAVPASAGSSDKTPSDSGVHLLPCDIFGGSLASPFDEGPVLASDSSLLLHPAALVCCDAAGDSPSAVACRWALSRVQLGLATAFMPAESFAMVSPFQLLPLAPLAAAAAATAALPRSVARAWRDMGWCDAAGSCTGAGPTQPFVALMWHARTSYVASFGRAHDISDDVRAMMQSEVELLQLQAVCAEAAPRASLTSNMDDSDGLGELDTGASGGGAPTGGGGGDVLSGLPELPTCCLLDACEDLTEWLRVPAQPLVALIQRCVYAAILLGLPLPSVPPLRVDTDSTRGSTAPTSPTPVVVALSTQLVPSVGTICESLGKAAEPRVLSLLSPLIRALATAQLRGGSGDGDGAPSARGSTGGRAAMPPEAGRAALALQAIGKCVLARVSSLLMHAEDDASIADSMMRDDFDDDDFMPRGSPGAVDDGDPAAGSGSGGGAHIGVGINPTTRGWLCALEEMCDLDPRLRDGSAPKAKGGTTPYAIGRGELVALLELAEHSSSAIRAPVAVAELAAALLPYADGGVRERVLRLLDQVRTLYPYLTHTFPLLTFLRARPLSARTGRRAWSTQRPSPRAGLRRADH